jgi:hypothetical protein
LWGAGFEGWRIYADLGEGLVDHELVLLFQDKWLASSIVGGNDSASGQWGDVSCWWRDFCF